jgi:hypothetical protein
MRRVAAVGVIVASLLVGACGGKAEPLGPTATVPQATTTTNPYAVPAVIDEAYVNRVLNGLDHAVGDVARLVVRERTVTPEVADRLRALYVGEALDLSVASFEADIRTGLPAVGTEIGDLRTVVTHFINASPSCVFVQTTRDYSAVMSRSDRTSATVWVGMRPSSAVGGGDREERIDFNPTGWVFIYDGFPKDQIEPSDPCVAFS